MSTEATKGVEAVLREGGQRLPQGIPHPAHLARDGPLPDHTGHRLRLAGLRELLQVREVHPLTAELDGVEAPAAGTPALAASQVYRGRVDGALPRWTDLPGCERSAGRELLCHLAGAGC